MLVKLEKTDASKNKRRVAVSKILGTINENEDDEEKRQKAEEMMRGELDNWSPDSTKGSIAP